MRPSSIHLRLHRILEHAGCDRVRSHDLRHTFAANPLAYGMDIKTLSTILSHVSSATALNLFPCYRRDEAAGGGEDRPGHR